MVGNEAGWESLPILHPGIKTPELNQNGRFTQKACVRDRVSRQLES